MAKMWGVNTSPNISGYTNSFFTTYRFFWQSVSNVQYDVWFRPDRAGTYYVYVDAPEFYDVTAPSTPTLTECNYGFMTGFMRSVNGAHTAFQNYKTLQSTVEIHGNTLTHDALALYAKLPGSGEVSRSRIDLFGINSTQYGGYMEGVLETGVNSRFQLGVVNNYSDVPVITMKSDGSVGVGTTNPIGRLQVVSPLSNINAAAFNDLRSNAAINIRAYGDSNDNLSIGLLGSSGNIGNNPSAYIQNRWDDALAADLLLQPAGGNVGIGLTNPSYKLQVNGTVSASEISTPSLSATTYLYAALASIASAGFKAHGGGSSNNWKSTGIGLNGAEYGGLVLLFLSLNYNNNDSTSCEMVFIRKVYGNADTYFTDATHKVQIAKLGASPDLEVQSNSGVLEYRVSTAGNAKAFTLEF